MYLSADGNHSVASALKYMLACQQRERDLWERVAAERIMDLMSCHKPDDCHARADSIEVLLDDVAYYREGRP